MLIKNFYTALAVHVGVCEQLIKSVFLFERNLRSNRMPFRAFDHSVGHSVGIIDYGESGCGVRIELA